MIDDVLTDLNQVTSEWLTEALTQDGALTAGAVASFETDDTVRELSANARFRLTYTHEAKGECPVRLFLKIVHTDMDDEFFGPSEVHYYTRDYAGIDGLPLVRCYHAAYNEEKSYYHLLLDDLSATHAGRLPKPQPLEYGLALAEGLAPMHAHWWGEKRLTSGGEPIPTAETIERFVNVARPGVEHIIAHSKDHLEPHWPDAMRALFAAHPQAMIDRTKDGSGFTLIHGDINPGNLLIPHEGYDPIYIVDRQPFDWSLTTWLGVYDLAYAIVHWWDIEARRAHEQPILRHYHEQLVKNGIEDYTWEKLFEDYKLCAAISVYVAVEWCRGGVREHHVKYWRPMLIKAMTALDDLGVSY